MQNDKNETDPYLWLENVEDSKALDWVKTHNAVSLERFQSDSRYAQMHEDLKKIAYATDRIPSVILIKETVFNFWQDKEHAQGIWRKISLKDYQQKKPINELNWEVLIDFDALSRQEKETWV